MNEEQTKQLAEMVVKRKRENEILRQAAKIIFDRTEGKPEPVTVKMFQGLTANLTATFSQ